MGMTIDECLAILSYPTYYFPSVREEALDIAIDTMRKYQKIQKIAEELKGLSTDEMSYVELRIREILDGNDD